MSNGNAFDSFHGDMALIVVHKGTVNAGYWNGRMGGDEVDCRRFREMNRATQLNDYAARNGHTWALPTVQVCCCLEREAR